MNAILRNFKNYGFFETEILLFELKLLQINEGNLEDIGNKKLLRSNFIFYLGLVGMITCLPLMKIEINQYFNLYFFTST